MNTFATSINISMPNNSKNLILTAFITLILLFIIHRIFFKIQQKLPVLVLKSCPGKKGVYCAVCLYDVAEGERYRKLPQCHHCFHVDCIDPWFETKSTCPLCRTQVPLNLLPRQTKKTPPNLVSVILYCCFIAICDKIKSRFCKVQFKMNWM